MNDYEHDRQAEIRFHLRSGPVIVSAKDFEEAVRQVFTNPARWMDGKRLGSGPMCIIDPKRYPHTSGKTHSCPTRIQVY